MRVSIIVSRFLPAKGGIISQVIYLSSALVRRGIEIKIHTGNVTFIGGKRICLPFSSLKYGKLSVIVERDLLPVAPLHLRLVRDPKNSDILNMHGHAELFTNSTLFQLSKLRKPIVLTTHCALISSLLGLTPQVKSKNISFTKSSLKRVIANELTMSLIKKYVNVIVTPTEAEKKILMLRGIPERRIAIVKNFVPDSYFNFNHEYNYLEYYNLLPYDYILTIARLDYNKSLDQVIRAIALLHNQDISVKYVIVGPDEGALKYYLTVARKLNVKNNIRYLNAITSKRVLLNLMRYSLAFILPSYIEGSPVAILEAMSQGTPVIISDTANFIGKTIQHMFNGLVFKYGDIKSLGQMIRILVEDVSLRKRLGVNAFSYAYEHHRLSKAAEKYVKIFKTLYEVYYG